MKVWTGVRTDLDIRVVGFRFAILEWSFVTLIFPGADGSCSVHGLSPHRLPLFPFPCQVLNFEGSLGKFVWRWEFTYLCKKLNVYDKCLGVVNSRLRECGPN